MTELGFPPKFHPAQRLGSSLTSIVEQASGKSLFKLATFFCSTLERDGNRGGGEMPGKGGGARRGALGPPPPPPASAPRVASGHRCVSGMHGQFGKAPITLYVA